MDMDRLNAPQSPRIDYCVLVATVQALQMMTATARAGGGFGTGQVARPANASAALPHIILGGDDWQQAVLAQQGSFNPAVALGR